MIKRIFIVRADKYETLYAICEYIEKYGEASKSQMLHGLNVNRSYPRISQTVDWLVANEVLSAPNPKKEFGKPGKVELFFTLEVSDWRLMFRPKRVDKKLESAKKRIEDLRKRMQEQEIEIVEQLRRELADEEMMWESVQADYERMIGK